MKKIDLGLFIGLKLDSKPKIFDQSDSFFDTQKLLCLIFSSNFLFSLKYFRIS